MTGKYLKSDLPAGFQDRSSKLDLLRWIAGTCRRTKSASPATSSQASIWNGRSGIHLESIHWQMRPADSRPLASAIVRQLHQRNFVLCLQGPDLYGFVHRTFLEYLIAEEIRTAYWRRMVCRSRISPPFFGSVLPMKDGEKSCA